MSEHEQVDAGVHRQRGVQHGERRGLHQAVDTPPAEEADVVADDEVVTAGICHGLQDGGLGVRTWLRRRWWDGADAQVGNHAGHRAVGARRAPSRSISRSASSTKRRSEEHTSELQSLMRISYAVFCLKKKHTTTT